MTHNCTILLMPVSQPPPAPPTAPVPSGSNPYDFILKQDQKPKGHFNGGSLAQRITIAVVVAAVLIIGAVIMISVLGGSSKSNTQVLVSLAQQQTEIARVAGIGADKADSATARNLAITTQLSMESAQQDTLALLKKGGHKVSDSTLGLLKDSQTDEQLNGADGGNTFDDTFTKLLHDKLSSYRILVQNDYKNATGVNERQVLQNSFNSVTSLLGDQKS